MSKLNYKITVKNTALAFNKNNIYCYVIVQYNEMH